MHLLVRENIVPLIKEETAEWSILGLDLKGKSVCMGMNL